MEILLFVVVVLLEFIAIVDVLRSYLSTAKKALWVIFILCAPIIGLLLYFLLGRPEPRESVQE